MRRLNSLRHLAVAGLIALAVSLGLGPSLGRTEPAAPFRITDAEQSVVRVIVLLYGANNQIIAASTGSGFVVARHRVMTNHHVIEGEGVANVTRREVFVVPDPQSGSQAVRAEVIRDSASPDLALLNAPDLNSPVIRIAAVYPDQEATIHALGYPGVTDRILGRGPQEMMHPSPPTVTGGSIALFSPVGPGGSHVPTIFHTAFINPGNSGGPLIDPCGRIIGINTWSGTATMSAGGGINIPQGQFIAIQSTVVLDFLRSAGVRAHAEHDVCVPPVDTRVSSLLQQQQAELAAMRAERAAELAANRQGAMIGYGLGGVVLILLLGAGAFLFMRRRPAMAGGGRFNPTTPGAATPGAYTPSPVTTPTSAYTPPPPPLDTNSNPTSPPPSAPLSDPTPIVQPAAPPVAAEPAYAPPPPPLQPASASSPFISQGAPTTASTRRRARDRDKGPSNWPVVLVVVAVFAVGLASVAFFAFSQMNPSFRLFGPPDIHRQTGPGQALSGNFNLTCTVSSGSGQDVTMTFDAETGCADLATPYEHTDSGWERLTFDPVTGAITRHVLTPDLATYSRSLYSPSRADFNRLQTAGGAAPACVQPGDLPALAQLAAQLRGQRTAAVSVLTGSGATVTWRCTPTPAARQPLPQPEAAPGPAQDQQTNAAAPENTAPSDQDQTQPPPDEQTEPSPQPEPEPQPPPQENPPQDNPDQGQPPPEQPPQDDQPPADDKSPSDGDQQ